MGYGKSIIIEIRIPPPPFDALTESATQHLTQAQRMVNEGNYTEVMTSCRRAMEEFQELIKQNEPKISDKLDVGSSAQQNEKKKSAKFLQLRKSVHNFLHMGPHAGYYVDRKDATLALQFTSTIGKYLAEILSEIK